MFNLPLDGNGQERAKLRRASKIHSIDDGTVLRSPFPTPRQTPALPQPQPVLQPQAVLPPQRDVVEGCKAMWTSCFQVGFISKRLFLESLSRDVQSVPLFLILAILSVSCRFTPCLVRRYGSSQAASEYFMQQASLLVPGAMYEPAVENVQAFLLLALAQWGHGDKIRSSTHMGIAVRMAGMLRLHREETYNLPANATTEEIVKAEIARRTFWVLETEDNLHTSHASPVPFSFDDITALLPCDESDFAFGRRPASRAAMPGTKAAARQPELVSLPARSIFATLLQAHSLWGRVARSAQPTEFSAGSSGGGSGSGRIDNNPPMSAPSSPSPPWDAGSSFDAMCRELASWEENIPANHRWSVWNMRGHSAEQVHLAYLSIVMVIRLANIIVRRVFLDVMVANATKGSRKTNPDAFSDSVANALYENVQGLMEPIEWFVSTRAESEGFSAILLLRTPQLCPRLAPEAGDKLKQSLEMLAELQTTWPLASRWLASLTRAAGSFHAKSQIQSQSPMTDNAEDDNDHTGPGTDDLAGIDENHAAACWTMPASLGMLTAAAAASEGRRPGPDAATLPETRPETRTQPNDTLLPSSSQTAASAYEGSSAADGESFEQELSEFLGIGSYVMMDVGTPLDDGARSWQT
ncbi:hypothetical protein SCUCBS95973_002903 [Sporothrix curviconia]|uniref:Xylanolytic transcriptional activator regulatory domain-containing protein n=1 Tax=Sporothrix curviconia TaxID=1260050 RepID=A0ABP0BAX9_9PEZI